MLVVSDTALAPYRCTAEHAPKYHAASETHAHVVPSRKRWSVNVKRPLKQRMGWVTVRYSSE